MSDWWRRDRDDDEPERPSRREERGSGRSYNSGPPPAAAPLEDEDRRAPIGGMPEDFRAPERLRPGGPVTADAAERLGPTFRPTPIYWTDDEWQPSSWPPERVARLQADLAAAGLIPAKANIQLGLWDPVSAAAYKELLGYSNAVGLPAEQAIELYRAGRQVEEFKPDALLRPDPARLIQDVKSAMASRLGRKPTESELDEAVGFLSAQYRRQHDVGVEEARREFEAERSPVLLGADGQEVAPAADEVSEVDPAAQFAEYMERQYAPEIDRNERVEEMSVGRDNLLDNILAMDRFMEGG